MWESGRSASSGGMGTTPQRPHANGRAMRVHGTLGFWGLPRPAKLVAGPVPNSLATERGRSVREFYAASESSPSRPRAELASANGVPIVQRKPDAHVFQKLVPSRNRTARRGNEVSRPSA